MGFPSARPPEAYGRGHHGKHGLPEVSTRTTGLHVWMYGPNNPAGGGRGRLGQTVHPGQLIQNASGTPACRGGDREVMATPWVLGGNDLGSAYQPVTPGAARLVAGPSPSRPREHVTSSFFWSAFCLFPRTRCCRASAASSWLSFPRSLRHSPAASCSSRSFACIFFCHSRNSEKSPAPSTSLSTLRERERAGLEFLLQPGLTLATGRPLGWKPSQARAAVHPTPTHLLSTRPHPMHLPFFPLHFPLVCLLTWLPLGQLSVHLLI